MHCGCSCKLHTCLRRVAEPGGLQPRLYPGHLDRSCSGSCAPCTAGVGSCHKFCGCCLAWSAHTVKALPCFSNCACMFALVQSRQPGAVCDGRAVITVSTRDVSRCDFARWPPGALSCTDAPPAVCRPAPGHMPSHPSVTAHVVLKSRKQQSGICRHNGGAALQCPSSMRSTRALPCRVFMYKWTVNWRMIPEELFLSRSFAAILLSAHLILLLAFFDRKWMARAGGTVAGVTACFRGKSGRAVLSHQQILTAVFTANFIGIICARSLHYQFYSWYFHSVPFLLWQTKLPVVLRLALFAVIEVAWNVFPSTPLSSSVLLGAHLVMLAALWFAP